MQLVLPQQYLQMIHESLSRGISGFELHRETVTSIWECFKKSERKLLNYKLTDGDDAGADPKYGLTLYALNHLILHEDTLILKSIGLPPSEITPYMLEGTMPGFIDEADRVWGWKKDNGSLVLNVPFAELDINWIGCAFYYLLKELGFLKTYKFVNKPVVTEMAPAEKITIALIGDWGTGIWKDGAYLPPSKLIGNAISELFPQPGIVIHLGDVYYSGLPSEEKNNLINEFPVVTEYNFTLNSNHECYSGSVGYFETALKDKIFKHQGGSSFFCIKFHQWVIIGLDTAFFDKSCLYQDGALLDANNFQQDFIRSLHITPDQKVILFTHHHAMDYTGRAINQPLVSHVHQALGDFYPDYWYYGHLHNGIFYSERSAMGDSTYKTRSGSPPKLRCVGNSAIPCGVPVFKDESPIAFYAKTPIDSPEPGQMLRILNGFALIKLSQNSIMEEYYDVSPVTGAKLVYST